jgi:hypothetical protein
MFQQNITQAFDKNNKLIKEFNHKNGTSINNCLRGIYKTAGNYKFKKYDPLSGGFVERD